VLFLLSVLAILVLFFFSFNKHYYICFPTSTRYSTWAGFLEYMYQKVLHNNTTTCCHGTC